MSGVTGELLLVAAEVLENVTSSSIPHLLGNTLAWEDVVTEVNLAFIQEILEAAVGASRVSSPALVPPVHAAATKAPQDPKATDPFRNGFSRRTRRPDRVVEHAAAVMALQQGHDLSTQVRIVDALAVEIGGASLALQPSGVLE